ncbi:MAG TPA: YihY/virulence factor BrkB family protein [Flavobacteriales bacterium]|nr:YihY/virulence factor BrkB family protein [Flavobacteriales bacterium]
MTNLITKLKQAIQFVKSDIWKIRLNDQPKNSKYLIRNLRIILLAFRGFDEDKCQLRASALTFYSLLSIVPVVAMIFGIAKGFGFEEMLEVQLQETMSGNPEIIEEVMKFANSMLENTKGGLIAGVGVIVLIWSVMKVLGNIENSFNDIWEIKRSRDIVRKFTDYLTIMLLAPILMILSGSVTVFITTQINNITESISLLGYFSPIIEFLIKLIPYSLVWLLLTFIYIVMPNTKVDFKSAFFAGIIAGTGFQLTEWIYINGQIGVAKYNAIYGSFAALPLFLGWLQISWLIVLFGAELSFAHQNVDRYELEIDSSDMSYSQKRILSLFITHLVVKKFLKGEMALMANDISDKLKIPIRIVRQILFDLQQVHIVSEIKTDDPKIVTYQPAISVNLISVKYVIEALEAKGMIELPAVENNELQSIQEIMKDFQGEITESKSNKLLKDI